MWMCNASFISTDSLFEEAREEQVMVFSIVKPQNKVRLCLQLTELKPPFHSHTLLLCQKSYTPIKSTCP